MKFHTMINSFLILLISYITINYVHYISKVIHLKWYNLQHIMYIHDLDYQLKSISEICTDPCKIHYVTFEPAASSSELEYKLNYYIYPQLPLIHSKEEFLSGNIKFKKDDLIVSSRPLSIPLNSQSIELKSQTVFYLYKAI